MGITVSNIMDLPLLREARIVAGAHGIGRHVEGISLLESPGSEEWLAKSNLVLNNSAALQYYADEPQRLIDVLADHGISCVAFKSDRFCGLPEELLRRADELDLPVIVFPYSLSASQLINAITYEIVRSESHAFDCPLVTDFLRNIVLRTEDRATLRKHMLTLGWTATKMLGLAIVHRGADVFEEGAFDDIARVSDFPYSFPLGADVLAFTELDGVEDADGTLVARTKALLQRLEERAASPDGRWLAGTGTCHAALSLLPVSLHEARTALYTGLAEGLDGVVDIRRLGFLGILLNARNWAETERIVDLVMKMLDAHDRENGTEYVRTVLSYARNHQSVETTAKELFVHRNTVHYRLRAITKLISGKFLDDNVSLNLQMLYQIIRWLDVYRRESAAAALRS